MNPLNQYGMSLTPGHGLVFKADENITWLVRSTALFGRFAICTGTDSDGTLWVTVVDWEANARGPLNLTRPASIVTKTGPDPIIDRWVAYLEDPRARVRVAARSAIELDVSEIIMPLEEHAEHFPGTSLEWVGPLPRLTLADRCDRCSSAALVSVRLRECGRQLQFCAHHYERSAVELATMIDAIVDQRSSLVKA